MAFGRGKSPPLPLTERAAFVMGSIVTFNAYCEDERLCNMAIDDVIREMKDIDRLMSVFDVNSEVSRINREGARGELRVDPRIVDILIHSRKFFDLTSGSFDITIEPLMELYGFRDGTHPYPSDRRIAHALESVGMKNVLIDPAKMLVSFGHEGTEIDLGGIAVGYSIDRGVGILKSYGIEAAIINHSGDIYAIGAPPGEETWEVGITDPWDTSALITSVVIKNQALSTSGNYENFVNVRGKTVGHLLDPSTGRTAQDLASGTVIAPTAVEADALSTGLFVAGLGRTKTLAGRFEGVRFIGVKNDRQTVEHGKIPRG